MFRIFFVGFANCSFRPIICTFLFRTTANCCNRSFLANCSSEQVYCKFLFPTTFFDKLSFWTIFWQIVVPNSFFGQGDPGGPHGTGDSEGPGSPGGQGCKGGQGCQGGIGRQAV